MGMVVTSAVWLLFVTTTSWPPARRGPFGFAVFVLTMTINEIPLVMLAVFAVSIAFTDHTASVAETVAAAMLAGATTFGLVRLQVGARATRTTLQAALDTGLGVGRYATGRGEAIGRLPATPWLSGILLPLQRRARGVQRLQDLSYGPERAHRLDVYRGPSTGNLRPVLVHLHGGGFSTGGKSREGVTLLNQLAAHGWLCASTDYRLGSAGAHPNPLVDTKRVIAWVREKAPEFGADPSQVFLAGSSAGGHLAVSAALTPDHSGLQPGFESADTSVAGVIVLYGYLGARTDGPSSSPARLARADAPPMLIIHGAHDTAVPVGSTRRVADTLRRVARRPVVFVELPHTQHSFDLFASVRARSAAHAAESFLDWARASRQQPAA